MGSDERLLVLVALRREPRTSYHLELASEGKYILSLDL